MKTIGALLVAGASVVLVVVVLAVSVLFPSVGPAAPTAVTSCTVTTATGKLSAAQVASVAYAAGFRGEDLVIITAISIPESGADSSAIQQNEPPFLTGVGLFQITPGTPADLDPLTNAQAAFAKYQGAGNTFMPWTTFTGGEYLAWMGWAAAGVANMSTAGLSCQSGPSASSAQLDVSAAQLGQVAQEATPPGLPATFDSYPWGQCTYWAALHASVPPYLGNASDWWANAAAHGLPESQTPAIGSVVVYGAGGGYSSDGHVAVVIAISGQTFAVTEMNYLGLGIVDERTSSMADVLGFIS